MERERSRLCEGLRCGGLKWGREGVARNWSTVADKHNNVNYSEAQTRLSSKIS